ncbi:MAG: long-chain fatty acid--CoA ligase [Chthonomonadales bacterium]|nr:long-chain fatty acid--CoA ligase [Chthonomonadales bacterium]
MVLYDIIRKGAEEYPDRQAILYREMALTYGDLSVLTERFARALGSRGLQFGAKIGVLLPNVPPFTIAYYGANAIGVIPVPANPLLKQAELEHIWGDAGVELVLTIPQLLEAAAPAAEALGIRHLICVGSRSEVPAGMTTFEEFLAEGAAAPMPETRPSPQDPAVFIYTSGTTGKPKGAVLSQNNLLANCRQIRSVLEFGPDDNLLCVLPLFHAFAGTVCQHAALYSGSRFTCVEMFQPARTLEIIETAGVTIVPAVPAMYAAMLQFGDRTEAFAKVRLCVSGGAPMPVALMEAFEAKFDTIIIEGDGPTECSPCTSVNPPAGPRKPGTIGLPLPGVEMRIVDDHDQELPPNTVGEIVVRGDNVMLGYHHQPEATAEAMRGGWYHTGDLGTVDEDGYFTIVDRKKDMLIVGGLNVYPREIEEVLYTHPAVLDAAVIGSVDPLRGEEVVAVIALKPEASADVREIREFCRKSLANYKVPRRVLFRETLPRSSTGKVLKRLLRKEMDLEPNGSA